MIITVFRSRVRPESREEYARWTVRMSELARKMPGYVSHKGFVAEDGCVAFFDPVRIRLSVCHNRIVSGCADHRKDQLQ